MVHLQLTVPQRNEQQSMKSTEVAGLLWNYDSWGGYVRNRHIKHHQWKIQQVSLALTQLSTFRPYVWAKIVVTRKVMTFYGSTGIFVKV